MKLKNRWSVSNNFLLGITAGDWWRLLRENRFRISPAYWHRAAVISMMSLMNSFYRRRERKLFDDVVSKVEIRNPPVFVLGHWRSGTTHLHNLLAQDDALFSYPNTYQVTNPSTFLCSEEINSRRFAKYLPEKRIEDNVALSFQSPQEDEFAPALTSFRSLYLGISFPRNEAFYSRFLTFKDATQAEIDAFKSSFMWFLKKLTYKSDRSIVIKSPPHTARIKILLEMFPDARFVNIHRHPYTVFKSHQHYFDTTMWYSYLQKPDIRSLDQGIMDRYKELYDAFFEQRELIPAGRYHEMSFEELESDTVGAIRNTYEALSLPGFEAFEPKLRRYADSVAGYKKNEFTELPEDIRSRMEIAAARCFQEWGYRR